MESKMHSRHIQEQKIPLRYDENIDLTRLTLLQKISIVRQDTTVEPTMCLYVIAFLMASLATQNLNLEKACRVKFKFGDNVCTALNLRERANLTFEEDEVQKLVASVQGWKSVVITVTPTVFMLFIGAWSDKTGRRKIIILLPIIGDLFTCLLNMISTYFFYEISVELTVLLEAVFPSFTGGMYMMALGTYSYIGDISSTEGRTFRLGVLSLCMTIGVPIGMASTGILLRHIGYYGVFGLAATIHLINFMYVFLSVGDHTWLEGNTQITRSGCIGCLGEFFDFQSITSTFRTVFKKKEEGKNDRRLRICLLFTAICLTYGPLWGEMSVFYIFVRYRFNWDEFMYSIYSTYGLMTYTIGTTLLISVFSKKLKVDDATLGMVSATSKVCGCLVLAFARTDFEIFMAPLAEMLNGTTVIVLRSIASKLVTDQELGKVYSLLGVAETLMALIFCPLYSRIYVWTLNVLPGAVFLVTVVTTVPSFIIFNWFYRQHKQDKKKAALDVEMLPYTEDIIK